MIEHALACLDKQAATARTSCHAGLPIAHHVQPSDLYKVQVCNYRPIATNSDSTLVKRVLQPITLHNPKISRLPVTHWLPYRQDSTVDNNLTRTVKS